MALALVKQQFSENNFAIIRLGWSLDTWVSGRMTSGTRGMMTQSIASDSASRLTLGNTTFFMKQGRDWAEVKTRISGLQSTGFLLTSLTWSALLVNSHNHKTHLGLKFCQIFIEKLNCWEALDFDLLDPVLKNWKIYTGSNHRIFWKETLWTDFPPGFKSGRPINCKLDFILLIKSMADLWSFLSKFSWN